MRGRPAEVDLCRRRTAERLMRAEVRVVDEAHLDLLHEILRHERPLQTQAERVFYAPQPPAIPIAALHLRTARGDRPGLSSAQRLRFHPLPPASSLAFPTDFNRSSGLPRSSSAASTRSG